MRILGLIGGISWQSTQLYYRFLNEEVEVRLGPGRSCEHVLYTASFQRIHALQKQDDWATLDALMASYAQKLQAAGAEAILICANTMHRCAPAVEATTQLPVIHIADATGRAIRAKGLNKVALLGTRFTMEGDFYLNRLREGHGLEVLVPDEEDKAIVHNIIYDELTRGIFTAKSRAAYAKTVERLRDCGAEGVILGCTEIPMLIGDDDVCLPTFNTTELHALAGLDWALG